MFATHLQFFTNTVAEDGDFCSQGLVDIDMFGQIDQHVQFLVAGHGQGLALTGGQLPRRPEVRQE